MINVPNTVGGSRCKKKKKFKILFCLTFTPTWLGFCLLVLKKKSDFQKVALYNDKIKRKLKAVKKGSVMFSWKILLFRRSHRRPAEKRPIFYCRSNIETARCALQKTSEPIRDCRFNSKIPRRHTQTFEIEANRRKKNKWHGEPLALWITTRLLIYREQSTN